MWGSQFNAFKTIKWSSYIMFSMTCRGLLSRSREREKWNIKKVFIVWWLNDIPTLGILFVNHHHHQLSHHFQSIIDFTLAETLEHSQLNQFYQSYVCMCLWYKVSNGSRNQKQIRCWWRRRRSGWKQLWIGFIILRQIQCNLMRENPIVFAFGSIL